MYVHQHSTEITKMKSTMNLKKRAGIFQTLKKKKDNFNVFFFKLSCISFEELYGGLLQVHVSGQSIIYKL